MKTNRYSPLLKLGIAGRRGIHVALAGGFNLEVFPIALAEAIGTSDANFSEPKSLVDALCSKAGDRIWTQTLDGQARPPTEKNRMDVGNTDLRCVL